MSRARRNGRAAVATVQAPVRCAIYTRKSTDEGLDRDFNSLDYQRHAAESYIESQRHEGWTALADRYDDGGFSGGNVERPALKRLMAAVTAGELDTIVVYRLDRLSRSLVDFGRIHEFLEKHGVSLVSVTESINTTSPHGRMMVNILLSFAQYERELVGERTRHKLHAARRLGKWTGGCPILGYDVVDHKLVINPAEAEQVKAIFSLYAERASVIGVVEELNRRGWRTKSWTMKDGRQHEGSTWTKSSLYTLLQNPLYVGLQKLGDETFPGEHQAIVPKALFRTVNAMIGEHADTGSASARNRYGALLRGLLRCAACGAAMVHSPVKNKGSRLYRYYVCTNAQKRGHASCPTKSVQADRIEQFVVERIRCIGADSELQRAVFEEALAKIAAERRGLKAESRRLDKQIAESRREAVRLVDALSATDGAARSPIQEKLEATQAHAETLQTRLREVRERQAALDAQNLDQADLARALAAFDPVWDALLAPEKERVLRLLIEWVRYDGATKRLEIDFRLPGIAELAAEVSGAA